MSDIKTWQEHAGSLPDEQRIMEAHKAEISDLRARVAELEAEQKWGRAVSTNEVVAACKAANLLATPESVKGVRRALESFIHTRSNHA